MMRFIFIGMLWCVSLIGAATAQTYSPGEHKLESNIGEARINSGFVSNLNAHTFYVYTFLFRPAGQNVWHQLPIVRGDADTELEFVITRTATADFTTRDARIVTGTNGISLIVAQLQYGNTPYDDDAHVRADTYRLTQLEDEGRWVLQEKDTIAATPGQTVEDVLHHVHPLNVRDIFGVRP